MVYAFKMGGSVAMLWSILRVEIQEMEESVPGKFSNASRTCKEREGTLTR